MQLRHRAALDGVQLDEVDSRIMISKIEPADGKESIQNVSLWGDSVGSRVTSIHRDSLDITVKFHIRLKKRSMAEREEVIEKVNAWALNGGWLTVNYKSNRRIRVFRAQAAGAGDPWEWTKEYSLIFRACGVPYWQEATPTTLRQQNVSSGTLVMGIAGSEKSVLDAEFRNTSGGTINSFSISTGEASMSFSLALTTDFAMIVLVMGSMVPVGSSRMMIRGSLIRTCANAILWHSPTERASG